MPAPPPYPLELVEAAARATAEAARMWAWSETVRRPRGRIVAAAGLAWDAAYPIAYVHGYTTLACRAASEFDRLHYSLRDAGAAFEPAAAAVHRLVEAALVVEPRLPAEPTPPAGSATAGPATLAGLTEPVGAAPSARTARGTTPDRVAGLGYGAAPLMPHRVLKVAAAAVMDRRDGCSAPEAVTQAVHREAVRHGVVHGVLTAAGDIYRRWRTHVGGDSSTVPSGQTLAEHVNQRLHELDRDLLVGWIAAGRQPIETPAALAGASFTAPFGTAFSPQAGPPHSGHTTVVPLRGRSRR